MSKIQEMLSEKRAGIAKEWFDMAAQRLETAQVTYFGKGAYANTVFESGKVIEMATLGRMIHEGHDLPADCLLNGRLPGPENVLDQMRGGMDNANRFELVSPLTVGPSEAYREADAQIALRFAERVVHLMSNDLNLKNDLDSKHTTPTPGNRAAA